MIQPRIDRGRLSSGRENRCAYPLPYGMRKQNEKRALTEAQVRELRERFKQYDNRPKSYQDIELAEEYGVSAVVIKEVRIGMTYRSVK